MLCRVPAEPLDRPYELNTVPRGLRSHAEHYIMSLHGIARINKGVVSEYSTLQEWDNHRRQAHCHSKHPHHSQPSQYRDSPARVV